MDITSYLLGKKSSGGSGGKYTPSFIQFQNYTGTNLEYETKNIDTSNITDMSFVFASCTNLEELDLSGWDTSNVTTFQQAFSGCTKLRTINFGDNFDTSKATKMNSMFASCTSLDDNTLNQILRLCINATSLSSSNKRLSYIKITDATLLAKIPTLSNYQDFINAGWTIN